MITLLDLPGPENPTATWAMVTNTPHVEFDAHGIAPISNGIMGVVTQWLAEENRVGFIRFREEVMGVTSSRALRTYINGHRTDGVKRVKCIDEIVSALRRSCPIQAVANRNVDCIFLAIHEIDGNVAALI